MSTSPLLSLPPELQLDIISYLPYFPRDHQRHLYVLLQVCKQLNNIVSTLLYTKPYVRISRTRILVDGYLAHPEWALKVRSLELYETEHRGLIDMWENARWREPVGAVRGNKPLRKMYTSLVRATGVSAKAQKNWQKDIIQESPRAWVGLLLAALPNLESLLLGGVSVAYLQRVDNLGAVTTPKSLTRDDSGYYFPEPHSYLNDVLMALAPRLRTLELPHETTDYPWNLDYTWNRSWPVTRCSAQLVRLIITSVALRDMHLPDMLQELRVSCEGVSKVNTSLRHILAQQLTKLRDVYIYANDHDVPSKSGRSHPQCVDEAGLAEAALPIKQAIDNGTKVHLVFSNHCCYFSDCLKSIIEDSGFMAYSDRELRVLELRGAFTHFETEAKRRERRCREESDRLAVMVRERRRQERRDRGERNYASDSDESDYCQYGIWD